MEPSIPMIIEDYRQRGAAQDQPLLVEMLREIQQQCGGALPEDALEQAAQCLGLKMTFLLAIVKRYPSLRPQQAPHRLELCGGPRCSKNGSLQLQAFLEREYGLRQGVSQKGHFSCQMVGCMKNCGKGPNLRWDGQLYSQADAALIRALVEGSQP